MAVLGLLSDGCGGKMNNASVFDYIDQKVTALLNMTKSVGLRIACYGTTVCGRDETTGSLAMTTRRKSHQQTKKSKGELNNDVVFGIV